MKGPEGTRLFRGAEDNLARKEEGKGGAELIFSHMRMAQEAVMSSQLIAGLQGENFFGAIKSSRSPEEKLSVAVRTLNNSPFLSKLLPNHLTDVREQAAYLVACAQQMNNVQYKMN